MNVFKELWHGNIIPQEDRRTNSKEMKELLGYMARHHEDLEKSFTDGQKAVFGTFHVAKPPKATSWQSRAGAGVRSL